MAVSSSVRSCVSSPLRRWVKCRGEPGPAVDLDQQVGDLDTRQDRERLPHQRLGFRRDEVRERSDLEDAVHDGGIRQFAALREAVDRHEGLVKLLAAGLQVSRAVGLDRQRQPRTPQAAEGLGRKQVLLEVLEMPAPHDRQVSGTQRVLELGHHAPLVETALDTIAGKDQRLPTTADETPRRSVGDLAGVGRVQLAQDVDRPEQLLAGGSGPELKRL